MRKVLLLDVIQSVYCIHDTSEVATYRVSHIKLDRVNGSKLRFEGQIRKFKKNEYF